MNEETIIISAKISKEDRDFLKKLHIRPTTLVRNAILELKKYRGGGNEKLLQERITAIKSVLEKATRFIDDKGLFNEWVEIDR